MELGKLLVPLSVPPAEKAFETQEDLHYHCPGTEHMSEHSGLRTLSSPGTLGGLSTGVKYFVVSVKAQQEARIALFRDKAKAGVVPDNTSVLYEFVIGASESFGSCYIQFGRSGDIEAEGHVENALDAGKFQDFWVSADPATGRVA